MKTTAIMMIVAAIFTAMLIASPAEADDSRALTQLEGVAIINVYDPGFVPAKHQKKGLTHNQLKQRQHKMQLVQPERPTHLALHPQSTPIWPEPNANIVDVGYNW